MERRTARARARAGYKALTVGSSCAFSISIHQQYIERSAFALAPGRSRAEWWLRKRSKPDGPDVVARAIGWRGLEGGFRKQRHVVANPPPALDPLPPAQALARRLALEGALEPRQPLVAPREVQPQGRSCYRGQRNARRGPSRRRRAQARRQRPPGRRRRRRGRERGPARGGAWSRSSSAPPTATTAGRRAKGSREPRRVQERAARPPMPGLLDDAELRRVRADLARPAPRLLPAAPRRQARRCAGPSRAARPPRRPRRRREQGPRGSVAARPPSPRDRGFHRASSGRIGIRAESAQAEVDSAGIVLLGGGLSSMMKKSRAARGSASHRAMTEARGACSRCPLR